MAIKNQKPKLDSSHPNFSDWRWQLRNSVKSLEDLVQLLPKESDAALFAQKNFNLSSLPFSITPYFVSLMNGTSGCPILNQVMATEQELTSDPSELLDPLGEEPREKVPHLIHRYPDRVLFLATDRCATYCRFCTRKRWVGQGPTPERDQQEAAFRYIESERNIKEIIFSGGDPLILGSMRIAELLRRAFSIDHVEIVRFHTRMLSFAPMRIDRELCEVFEQFSPIYLVTHFNHPSELTTSALDAVNALIKSKVVVLNQSVLLRGINDDEQTLAMLMRSLVKNKIRPYYLHQCDVINGSRHFRVPIAEALSLVQKLRGYISGLCLPTFVIDIPGGHGKVALTANPIVSEDERFIYLRGYAGGIAPYPKD